MSCECANWARAINLKYATNHHQRCDRYNDSLIDVWRVSLDGQSYVTDKEPTDLDGEEIVTQEQMHKEVYESLGEFAGF